MRCILVFSLLAGCVYFSCRQVPSAYISIAGEAQGTTFQITYRDSLQRDFSSPVDSIFRVIDISMSLWNPNSIISRINRNDSLVVVDEHFRKVVHRSLEISKSTNGAFDVTVGPLIQEWKRILKEGSGPPDTLAVKQLLNSTGYQKISLQENKLVKAVPEIQLDFNGIAQGYTVDLIATFLLHHGVNHFLVEIGGELHAAGLNERGIPWQVGIDKPIDTISVGRPLQTSITLDNKALATSGSYRNYLEKDGKKFNHIINPKTGYPVDHDLVSVSVIAPDCMTADALATAFMVIGMEKAFSTAMEEQVDIYCIYKDKNGNLKEKATPGFSMQ